MNDAAPAPNVTGSAKPAPAPISAPERIIAIDVLRGFALLGILVMNIQGFATISAAYMNPTAYGTLEGGEYVVWLLCHLFADQKFMTIFSLLFGAGIVIMADRQQAKGRSAAALHYRRMAWLLVIGLIHGYLIWYGDILYIYALCGAIVFLLRRLPPWLLVVFGILSISVASAYSIMVGFSIPYWPEEQLLTLEREDWAPPADLVEKELAIYRGSWLEQLPHRAEATFFMQTFLFLILFLWRAGGLMLIGMALYRWGVLTGKRSNLFYTAMIVIGLFVGLPLIMYGVRCNFAAGWGIRYSFFHGGQFNYWGSLMMSTAYIGAIMIACKYELLTRLLRPLAAVGQMALTNYLLHSIVCTTIFYGHGFGQFGHFSRVQQIMTVFAIWAVQLAVSPIWLHYFRFGPFEWLWRSLSYWHWQPIRR